MSDIDFLADGKNGKSSKEASEITNKGEQKTVFEWSKLKQDQKAIQPAKDNWTINFSNVFRTDKNLEDRREKVLGEIKSEQPQAPASEPAAAGAKSGPSRGFWDFLFGEGRLEDRVSKLDEKRAAVASNHESPISDRDTFVKAKKEAIKKEDLTGNDKALLADLQKEIMAVEAPAAPVEKKRAAKKEKKTPDAGLPAGKKPEVERDSPWTPSIGSNLIKGEIYSYINWKKNFALLFIFATFAALMVLTGNKLFETNLKTEEAHYSLKNINAELASISQQEVDLKDDLAEAKRFKQKLDQADNLLDNHIFWNNFFSFLEGSSTQGVVFKSFSGNTAGVYSISASVGSFAHMSEFLAVLKKNPFVLALDCSEGKMSKEGVSFTFEMTVNPEIFKNKYDK